MICNDNRQTKNVQPIAKVRWVPVIGQNEFVPIIIRKGVLQTIVLTKQFTNYYAEFAMAAPWSAKLPEGHRAGFSPSATVGWKIAKERFMEGSFFDDLTLSASYSNLKSDLDIKDYYMYLGTYQDGGWWDWNGESGHSAVQSKRGGNEALTWIKRKEISASLHAEVLKRSLSIDASFFSSEMDGGIITATNQMPSYFKVYYPESSFLSNLNYNKDSRTGFDLAVNYKKNLLLGSASHRMTILPLRP